MAVNRVVLSTTFHRGSGSIGRAVPIRPGFDPIVEGKIRWIEPERTHNDRRTCLDASLSAASHTSQTAKRRPEGDMAAATRSAVRKVVAARSQTGAGAQTPSVEAAVNLAWMSWCPTETLPQNDVAKATKGCKRAEDAWKVDEEAWKGGPGEARSMIRGFAASKASIGHTAGTPLWEQVENAPARQEVQTHAKQLRRIFGNQVRPQRKDMHLLLEPWEMAPNDRLDGTACEDIRADSVKRKRKKKMNKHKFKKRRKLNRHKNT